MSYSDSKLSRWSFGTISNSIVEQQTCIRNFVKRLRWSFLQNYLTTFENTPGQLPCVNDGGF